MRLLNENDIEISHDDIDLEKGHIIDDRVLVRHHNAEPEIQEISHYVTIAEYPNGGKDVKKVIDTPYSPAKEAWDEYEDIQRYVLYTDTELAEIDRRKKEESINDLKKKLSETDYVVVKMLEMTISETELLDEKLIEYKDTIQHRQAWRDEINRIEEEIENGKNITEDT